MSKSSGWRRWKDQYGKFQRATDKGSAGDTPETLTNFAETSKGPVARALFEQELVDYDESGTLQVQRDNVKEAAARLTKDAQYVNTGRKSEEIVKSIQYLNEGYTERQAVNLANKSTAAQAQAVLDAARVGKVALTPAQRERLNDLARGKYIEPDKLPRQKGPSYRQSRDRLYEQARYEEQREQLAELRRSKDYGYNSQRVA